jgi:hypothetical protein
MVKAILLKPLDGFPEGTEREFEKEDFDRLKDMGAVRAASGGSRTTASDSGNSEKAAPAVDNKMAPRVENKSRTRRR